jgi:hypothetical protein
MYVTKRIFMASALTLALSVPAWCQANINEGLETATLYVDGANGSDSNPGTASQPLQTIGKSVLLASQNNSNNVGTRVIINPGIYREAVTMYVPTNATSMPMTFEAAINGTVIVSGAQQWTGWQPYSGNSNIYTNTWPYAWGLCAPLAGAPPAPDIVERREMVFVEGFRLNEVLSLSDMTVGTFYVNETAGTMYVWPQYGVNIYSADVEVSVEPNTWMVNGVSNFVIRGLTFEYGNPCRDTSAVFVNSAVGAPYADNFLFDSDNFFWNNAIGVEFGPTVSNFTVQNTVANHNGQSGLVSQDAVSGYYYNNQTAFNNWRGAQGAFYNTNSAGIHFSGAHGFIVDNSYSYWNQTFGTHFDTDNENITIDDFVMNQNLLAGALLERDEGPIDISYSYFCNGSPVTSTSSNVGIDIRDSIGVSTTYSNFVGNVWNININGLDGGYTITNWQTGAQYFVVSENATFMDDIFANGSGALEFNDTYNWDWSYYQPTLISNYNTWWNSSTSSVYLYPLGNSQTTSNLSGWQAATGQDQQSVWSAPTGSPGAACDQVPDMVDYWLLVPYSDTDLTVNPGASAVWPVNMVPLRWFKYNVNLSYDISSIPGATASFQNDVLGPNQTTNFTLNTSSSTPPGTYQFVIIGTSGSLTRTITAMLTVQ